MTLNELAYSLLGLVRGDYKDNDYLDIRLIYHFIHTQRANWVAKELGKPNPNIESFEQDLGALLVETVSSNPYSSIATGANFKRTVESIPKPLYKKGMPLITRIGSIDYSQYPFDIITLNRVSSYGTGKFNVNSIGGFYSGSKVYLMSRNNATLGGLEYINVRGIFENPTEVGGFTTIDGNVCYSPDDNYPISAELIDYLHGDIMQYKLRLVVDTPSDRSNNADTDLTTNSATK